MTKISFESSWKDSALIHKIALRAVKMAAADRTYRLQDAMMDITVTHCNGCPLKLADLLAADDFNFSHDIYGIRRHLNRDTGKLEDHFLPRFSDLAHEAV